MASDLQQWCRKIQPSRARTPALDGEEIDDAVSPPKQTLKSKVSSYFDLKSHPKPLSVTEDISGFQLPEPPVVQQCPDPNAEDVMDSIMCMVMSAPYTPLDARFNSTLMRIFESYMKLKDDREQIVKRLDQRVATNRAMAARINMMEKEWADEKRDYKEEVKRLEVLLSKTSKRGLAEVTLARQDSKLRTRRANHEDRKETIFEVLDKAQRLDDSLYTNQRAIMKPLLPSPSDKDKRMSQRLTQKKSMTNILHDDLPFGTPPDKDMRFSLMTVPLLEQQTECQIKHRARPRAVTASTSTSEDGFSAFSCDGDLLPDEAAPAHVKAGKNGQIQDVRELADVIRIMDPARVMPQLLDIFGAPHPESVGISNVSGMSLSVPQQAASARIVEDDATGKRQNMMSRATSLFRRSKPQLSEQAAPTTHTISRSFSFETGDDVAYQGLLLGGVNRLLRKSASLDVLQQRSPARSVFEQSLPPMAASPTTSAPTTDIRPPSRIPTPVYGSGTLARPRQEREDSATSLLTAIKISEEDGGRRNSQSSSVYSSPSVSREDVNKLSPAGPGFWTGFPPRSSSSNCILDHTNARRGGSVMAVAARTASISNEASAEFGTREKAAPAYSHKLGSREIKGENMPPMGAERPMKGPKS